MPELSLNPCIDDPDINGENEERVGEDDEWVIS
ncbi:hypothetical protein ADUPG1_014487, partial [Aduncisulcus paluster]